MIQKNFLDEYIGEKFKNLAKRNSENFVKSIFMKKNSV